MDYAKQLMLDDFELMHLTKFIERFEMKEETLSLDLFFIALATKLLMNPLKVKEPIEVYLARVSN